MKPPATIETVRLRLRSPVIEEEGSTLVVGPRARFMVAPSGNVVVTLDA